MTLGYSYAYLDTQDRMWVDTMDRNKAGQKMYDTLNGKERLPLRVAMERYGLVPVTSQESSPRGKAHHDPNSAVA